MTVDQAQDLFWGFWILLHLVVWLVVLWKRIQRREWGAFVINLFPPIAVWTIWAQIGDWTGQALSTGVRSSAAALKERQVAADAEKTQKQKQQRTQKFIRVLELERQGIAFEAACEAEGVDSGEYQEWRSANVTDPET